MISESVFAKNKILDYNKKINNILKKPRITTKMMFDLQIDLFNGMFLFRKLIESHKISDSIANAEIKLVSHKCILQNNSLSYWFDRKHYDFSNHHITTISRKNLANQFIHSFHFYMSTTKNNNKKDIVIMFCSDKKKNHEIYSIFLSEINDIFLQIGNNYPNSFKMISNSKGPIFYIE